MFDYIWLVLVAPLVGVLVNGLFGKRMPRWLAGVVGVGVVGVSLVTALAVFSAFLGSADKSIIRTLYPWITAGNFRSDFAVLIDPLSMLMVLVVTGVGFFIHLYSTGYMGHDSGYSRFFTYMNLFTFSMLLLVLANNYLLMFVGWELVGLCSYLLIGFWYKKESAYLAGKKAFIVTRIGDWGFMLGIILVFITFGSFSFADVFPAADTVSVAVMTAITLLLFLGAVGKSAQIPLYVWLPDAMEGPTPVSALIHAATMVTAGVYMVSRSNAFYVEVPGVMYLIASIGVVTAFFAATIAVVNHDIKRVLAYSTISQIGYMFLGAGVGAFVAAMFHLFTHAFFKALLFLGAGSVMHGLDGETDLRKMGGLGSRMKITGFTFLMGTLAIAGIPIWSGFFSKDEILWAAYASPFGATWLYVLGLITAALTSFYMFRLYFKTFSGQSRVPEEVEEHVHESPPSMTTALVVLAIGATFAGFLGIPEVLSRLRAFTNLNAIEHFLEPVLPSVGGAHAAGAGAAAGHSPALELTLMGLTVLLSIAVIVIAYYFYVMKPGTATKLAQAVKPVYNLVYHKYYVDEVYNYLIVRPGKALANWLWRDVDEKAIDGAVNGTAGLVGLGSNWVRRVQTGYIRSYALTMLAGIVVVVAYFITR